MTVIKTQQEIIQKGYQVLVESSGIIDALRFIQYFDSGQGDYTRSHQAILNQTPLEDILAAMKQTQSDIPEQYDEIIE